jgi:Domain of unknown function (DUF4189)
MIHVADGVKLRRFGMVGLRFSLLALLTASVWWPTNAVAQTFVCPNGPGPGEIQVGTTGGSGGIAVIPICASDGSEDQSEDAHAAPAGPEWEDRWGAIARGKAGGWGAVGGMLSRRSAEKAALKQCETTASTSRAACKVSIAYYNQCAVYVWGSSGGVSSSAVDITTASQQALTLCNKTSSDCEIIYSNCSYPKQLN